MRKGSSQNWSLSIWAFLKSYRNSSRVLSDRTPPQEVFDRKSTGEVTWGVIGNRSRKSRSGTDISSFAKSI